MKTAVTTPVEGYTGIVAGVVFVDGRGETEDQNSLAYFRRHGYHFGGGPVEPLKEANAALIPEGDPTDKWKVPALKAYADREGIDLDGATKKDEILAAIAAHEADGDDADDPTAADTAEGTNDDDSGNA